MTSNYFFVSIKLCLDVGNKEHIILCYCDGCIMSGFAINNYHHHHKTFSIINIITIIVIIITNYFILFTYFFLSMLILLIVGFTYPPTTRFKVITKCGKCYYKVRQFYYKVRQNTGHNIAVT